jgi:3-oxoacyl-(acyl-carrier-protein) synthase/3-hydroxymyristoyl/3-hydroxydecanoyl-(acyl carrier protein) dehydratase
MKSIAIVSAGIRFPGAKNLLEFTSILENGSDLSAPTLDSRWQKRGDREPKAEGYFHSRAYRIEDWQTTAEGLSIEADVLAKLDPLFHLGLGAAKDAFYASQTSALDRKRAGVILGNIALPTESSSQMASEWLSEQWGLDRGQSSLSSENLSPAAMPAVVIAQALGFAGSTFTLDAACASSLYALKLACDELMEGRLDFVLAGGLSRPDPLYTQVGFTALDALSRAGRSYPLDSRADGLMVGEGAGIFGLKRLEDAERQGDTILAVIRGVGLSNDREAGLMAPSSEGQWRAMQAAYVDAEWDPKTVELIECHATGTPLGDATEIKSLGQIRNAAPAVIGSVKGNVGHMLTAAGAAGVAKLILSFQEKKFWPTANFESAPAAWELEKKGLRILKKAEAWTSKQELRRAAISGFGFGGINAHMLLEEYDSELSERVVRIRPRRKVAVVRAADLEAASTDYAAMQIGYKQFRIPPREMQDILPQQIWSLLAMSSLGQFPGLDKEKVGCFVGVELDPLTNLFATRWKIQDSLPQANLESYMPALQANQVMGSLASIAASRCSRELQLGGASFTVAAMEASGLKALELAFRAISRGEMHAALVMATDMGTSHRADSQRQERQGQTWTQGADESVALILMDEQKTIDAGLSVSILLDDFSEFDQDLDLPLSEGNLWLEDMKRDSHWVRDLGHRSKKMVEGHRYRGAAHGLSSLVRIWTHEGSSRGSFLLRDHKLHHVSWFQKKALPLEKTPRVDQESYSVHRRDRHLVSVETLFGGVGPAAASTKGSAVTHITHDESSASSIPRAVEARLDLASSAKPLSGLAAQLIASELRSIEAHEQFLAFRGEGDALIAQLLQSRGLASVGSSSRSNDETQTLSDASRSPWTWVDQPFHSTPALYDYDACTEFAEGQIAKVFGPEFAEADQFPTRVRLPAERLLLCHRVMSIQGEKKTLGSGKMTTEHDVFPNAWYLDGNYMPTAIAVESGQADLMLSAYLGADFATRGEAVYRLLDARVSFHSDLPKVGETIRYDIEIKKFFEQGGTLFFNFAFEAYIGDRHLMSMVDGCAGFFSQRALDEGRGVKRSQLQLRGYQGKIAGDYKPFVPMATEAYSDAQINALQRGDYVEAFGPAFAKLNLAEPKSLPSGDMKLVHRILSLEPEGGRFGIGRVIGEADIHPDDWFLTCHFIDDQVMPGTLMFECCLHTLRVFLMRAGWVGEASEQNFLPVPGIYSQLKCRGQVLASTQKVTYEIEIKEMGYGPDAYVICDALMYADGKPIVDIIDMSLRIPGFDKAKLEGIWSTSATAPAPEDVNRQTRQLPVKPQFTYEHILAFSDGNPSDCFGPIYKPFDKERKIARLPRPPFQFLDSVEWVEGPYMKQNVGTRLLAHYELPDDAWFWACHQNRLPFSVLVEIALQPCGFMAAYMGSALQSETDLKFRNLSGEGLMLQDIRKGSGRLSIEVASTKIARSGDMIIQDYSFRVFNQLGDVYVGTTSFGFFTEAALAQQAGIRGEAPFVERTIDEPYPLAHALPSGQIRMVLPGAFL